MDINGQIALVTGAGRGLGAATARRLAADGARVVLLDRDGDNAASVAADIGGLAIAADVASDSDVETAFSTVSEKLGSAPRVAINCAGIGSAARIVGRDGKLSLDLFERTLQVNLIGTFRVLSHAARAMMALDPLNDDGERGVIINTASVAVEDGQYGQTAYSASKGGIASLTLPAARELSRSGIRVAAIAPGLFETAMTAGLPDDVRTAITANIPFPQRLGQPEEYASLAAEIIRNPMLNGSLFRLDGAVRLPPK